MPDPTPVSATQEAPAENNNTSAMQLFAPDPNAPGESTALDLDELFHDCYFGEFPMPEEVTSSTAPADPVASKPTAAEPAMSEPAAPKPAAPKRSADQAGLDASSGRRPSRTSARKPAAPSSRYTNGWSNTIRRTNTITFRCDDTYAYTHASSWWYDTNTTYTW